MADQSRDGRKTGDWATVTFPGGINANLNKITEFLMGTAKKNADVAKIVEGTDQSDKPICAVFWKV